MPIYFLCFLLHKNIKGKRFTPFPTLINEGNIGLRSKQLNGLTRREVLIYLPTQCGGVTRQAYIAGDVRTMRMVRLLFETKLGEDK